MSCTDRPGTATRAYSGRPREISPDLAGAGDTGVGDAIPSPRGTGPDRRRDVYEDLEPLLAAHAASPPGSGERARLRDRLVAGYLPVAHNIARRYARRGEPIEDLIQVASIGLIHAIDRYDPGRGDHFLAFAVPTITGEVRRHFRDRTWSMRVPRRLKDLHVVVNSTVVELSQRLGRAPRPSEIAGSLELPTDTVLEVLAASLAYQANSLDSLGRPGGDGDVPARGEFIGAPDPNYDLFTDSRAVAPYLAARSDRERTILIMRFYRDMTQTQIAEEIGISQMHVSRLLSATLARLRDDVNTDQPTAAPRDHHRQPAPWRPASEFDHGRFVNREGVRDSRVTT